METKRLYMIVFMILGLTFLVEGLKHYNQSTANLDADRMTLAWSDVGVKPFAIHYDETPPSIVKKAKGLRGGFRLMGKPVGGFQSYDFSEGQKVADKKAEDDKTAKDKKKKARHKKKKTDKTMVATRTEPLYYDESKSNKKSAMGMNDEQGLAPGFAQPNPQDENKEPKTFEEWSKLILSSPSLENVQKMIESYKSGQTTSEVFYSVLNAMLKTDNSTQHELAVFAAGNIMEANSFIFLVDALKTTPNINSLSGQISEYLNNYRTPRNIALMRPVISQRFEDVETVNIAVQLISRSTTQYLEQRSPSAATGTIDANFPVPTTGVPNLDPAATGSNTGGGRNGQTVDPKNYYKFYKNLETVLEQVIARYADQSEMVDSATKSLARIRAAKPVELTSPGQNTILAGEANP